MPIQRLLGTYRPLLHRPEQDPELLAWARAADKLDAHLKCAIELAVGNREFATAKRQFEQTLRGLSMQESGACRAVRRRCGHIMAAPFLR